MVQFAAFVEASGYKPGDRDALKGMANHPVVWVSWHEALAYCRWLNERLRELAPLRLSEGQSLAEAERAFWQGLPDGSLGVGLPSEAEWEKAARGTDGRVYPWGRKLDPERVNYRDTGLNSTSTVGCFPRGASPYGCEEMSGNVWEWTRSIYEKYPYPEEGSQRRAREGLKAKGNRVLRGGSFGDDFLFVRCPAARPLRPRSPPRLLRISGSGVPICLLWTLISLNSVPVSG